MSLNDIVRRPAVAGHFYPAHPRDLRAAVERGLAASGMPEEKLPARAVMVPHAGYQYSGKTAGVVYGKVAFPSRIVMLGPNHTGIGAPISIFPQGEWETPLGRVRMDADMASAVAAACPSAKFDTVAHMREHAIEVQMPFLQTILPEFRATAVTVGTGDYARLKQLGEAVAEAVNESEEPAIILISSDMTHYEDAESARRKDRHALDALEALDARELHHVVQREGISMCGWAPAVAALAALAVLGARGAELLDYSNSGDATGDYRSVVAYAGMRMF